MPMVDPVDSGKDTTEGAVKPDDAKEGAIKPDEAKEGAKTQVSPSVTSEQQNDDKDSLPDYDAEDNNDKQDTVNPDILHSGPHVDTPTGDTSVLTSGSVNDNISSPTPNIDSTIPGTEALAAWSKSEIKPLSELREGTETETGNVTPILEGACVTPRTPKDGE